MIQLQYYNGKLKKTQIDNILNNFNIKYTTFKNEIESKVNNLLKLFLNDIKSFIENIEEISKERKKLKEFDNLKKQQEILSLKLKEKTMNEGKLLLNIESLKKEIIYLKNEKHKSIEMTATPLSVKRKQKKSPKYAKVKQDTINDKFNKKNKIDGYALNMIKKAEMKKLNDSIKNISIYSSNKRRAKEMLSNDFSYRNETNNESPDFSSKKLKNFKNIETFTTYSKNPEKIQGLNFMKKNLFRNEMNKNSKFSKSLEKNNKTFEPAKDFIDIPDTLSDKREEKNAQSSNSSNNEDEEVENDTQSIENEIKDLEEDENNILNLIHQLGELKSE